MAFLQTALPYEQESILFCRVCKNAGRCECAELMSSRRFLDGPIEEMGRMEASVGDASHVRWVLM